MNNTKICHSVDGACKTTDFSRSYLYIAIKEGRLKSFKRGHRTFITDEELRKFINAEIASAA
jgi:hypothetical protein